MSIKKYMLTNSNQEAHFPDGNTSVAVCWNIKEAQKSIKGKDGLTYKAETWEREEKSGPYICFMNVREYKKGEFFRDEDSPVDGGMSTDQAHYIAEELAKAIKYAHAFTNKMTRFRR